MRPINRCTSCDFRNHSDEGISVDSMCLVPFWGGTVWTSLDGRRDKPHRKINIKDSHVSCEYRSRHNMMAFSGLEMLKVKGHAHTSVQKSLSLPRGFDSLIRHEQWNARGWRTIVTRGDSHLALHENLILMKMTRVTDPPRVRSLWSHLSNTESCCRKTRIMR